MIFKSERNNNMSELYNKRIKQAYENAKGSMEIEGFRFTDSDEKLITAYLKKKSQKKHLLKLRGSVLENMVNKSLYTYDGTDVLKNKFGIKDQAELEELEKLITTAKIAELEIKPIQGNFDLDHLKKIHKHIFEDIYEFAGQIRQENIAKDFFSFGDARFIESGAKELFGQLKQENYLKVMSPEKFSERAAHYLAEINVLHPFREGNGRSQREFTRTLAKNADYKIEWNRVSKREMMDAMIKSHVNTKELENLIKSVITPIQKNPEKTLIRNQNKSLERG
ncbi:Fic/DOC family protein [Bacillus thuringiensis]|nr:Fic family protein [Bacillus thuringiensis]